MNRKIQQASLNRGLIFRISPWGACLSFPDATGRHRTK